MFDLLGLLSFRFCVGIFQVLGFIETEAFSNMLVIDMRSKYSRQLEYLVMHAP